MSSLTKSALGRDRLRKATDYGKDVLWFIGMLLLWGPVIIGAWMWRRIDTA